MKGYHITHGLADCQECEFYCGDFRKASYEGRKHYEKTGHEIHIEIGLVKRFEKKLNNE